ncbi:MULTISPECIES: TetR/AcrR family transcriptional regulator [unclassified Dietzia]|uniref:TetR/AcrR family transcriptional regulator n=1 Tax=unclassified Dietzia TaxID=2617939 RepID=UPI0015FE3176|nr:MULTISPECIES: TetR/AcrR family transcriptional regulator [unclassified Dietzia]MBB1024994.1 TetR/AcrR family transcriptional regulator [Dietzia sp. DQ12-76]MBB1027983.1 TetR/AcrR family transcriptional regulator [Dietzia sp. DQ11-38-2]
MTSARSTKPGPRERLLATSTRLFSTDGIRAVGIDRILREAKVAKASLYNTYGSKDELVVAYLRAMADRDRALWQRRADAAPDSRGRILALFDLVRERVEPATPGSCHLAAAIEFPSPCTDGERAIREAVTDQRAWVASTLRSELAGMGLEDPDNIADLADRLAILHDGSVTAAMLGEVETSAMTARSMAELILGMVTEPS